MSWNILIVDDDDAIAGFLTDVLEMGGHKVFRADNGDDGLKQARSLKPDLLFLDLNMPGYHGFEVLQRLRGDPEAGKIKVVVTSAKSYPVDIQQALSLGADIYLAKPYTVDQVRKTLDILLASERPS